MLSRLQNNSNRIGMGVGDGKWSGCVGDGVQLQGSGARSGRAERCRAGQSGLAPVPSLPGGRGRGCGARLKVQWDARGKLQ